MKLVSWSAVCCSFGTTVFHWIASFCGQNFSWHLLHVLFEFLRAVLDCVCFIIILPLVGGRQNYFVTSIQPITLQKDTTAFDVQGYIILIWLVTRNVPLWEYCKEDRQKRNWSYFRSANHPSFRLPPPHSDSPKGSSRSSMGTCSKVIFLNPIAWAWFCIFAAVVYSLFGPGGM